MRQFYRFTKFIVTLVPLTSVLFLFENCSSGFEASKLESLSASSVSVSCTLAGATYLPGQTVASYTSASATSPALCVSAPRTCLASGQFDGPVVSSCVQSCVFPGDGVAVAAGSTNYFAAASGATCTPIAVTCLQSTGKFNVNLPATAVSSCNVTGQTCSYMNGAGRAVPNGYVTGSTVMGYAATTAVYPSLCSNVTSTCQAAGSWNNGAPLYTACVQSCSLNGNAIAQGVYHTVSAGTAAQCAATTTCGTNGQFSPAVTGTAVYAQCTAIAAPVISAFTATPSTVASGQTATLNWTVTSAAGYPATVKLNSQTTTGTSFTTPALTATTTYTLTATNTVNGVTQTTTATRTVTVGAPTPTPTPPGPVGACDKLPAPGVWQNITPPGKATAVNGTVGAAIIVDPFDSRRVWLGTGSENDDIWRSDDCGSTWTKVNIGPGGVGDGKTFGGVGDGAQWSMQADPVTKDILYAVSGYGAQSLWKTTDGGFSWIDILAGSEYEKVAEYRFVNNVSLDPTDHLHLVVSTHGPCKAPYTPSCNAETKDGGKTWTVSAAPEAWYEGGGLIIVKGGHWIWCGTNMLVTKDSGKTWNGNVLAGGGTCEAEYTIRSFVPASNGKYYLGSRQGVLRSADGEKWEHIPGMSDIMVMVTQGSTKIFASNQWQPTIKWANLSNDQVWTSIPAPPQVSQGKDGGIPFLAFDDAHGILYASMFSGGVARMVIAP